MKKIAFTLSLLTLAAMPLMSQDLSIDVDSLHKDVDASEFEVSLLAHVWNHGNQNITLKWERNIVQLPSGWQTFFCDKNLCYSGGTSSQEFDLAANGDTSILKPLFRPNGNEGTCIYHIKLTSLTPGVTYEETVVYVVVATITSDVAEVLSAKDVVVYPNPTTDELTVAVANPNFKGSWTVINANGQVLLQQKEAASTGTLDVSELPEGLYFLNISTEDGQVVATKRFAKR